MPGYPGQGGKPPTPNTPSWWQKIKQQLQSQLKNIPVGGTPSPLQSVANQNLPVWLRPKTQTQNPVGWVGSMGSFAPSSQPFFPSSVGGGQITGQNQQPISWQSIHGSDIPIDNGPTAPDVSGSDYGGGGYGYKRRRYRGGRRGYTPRQYTYGPSQPQEQGPAWANTGVANWSIG